MLNALQFESFLFYLRDEKLIKAGQQEQKISELEAKIAAETTKQREHISELERSCKTSSELNEKLMSLASQK